MKTTNSTRQGCDDHRHHQQSLPRLPFSKVLFNKNRMVVILLLIQVLLVSIPQCTVAFISNDHTKLSSSFSSSLSFTKIIAGSVQPKHQYSQQLFLQANHDNSIQALSRQSTTTGSKRTNTITGSTTTRRTVLYSSSNNNNKKSSGELDSVVRTKLLSESIAPWRSLRLFLYVSFASGAAIGGFITLTGTLALLSGVKDGNLNTELLNLGIDFGAVAVFVLLFKWDFDKQNELNVKVEEKIAMKKESKKRIVQMKEREEVLKNLKVSIQTSTSTQQDATIRELLFGAKQNIIIVIGTKKVCRDALIGANLLKMDFASSNILVVPYDIDAASIRTTPSTLQSKPTGFATSNTNNNNNNDSTTTTTTMPLYETKPYVARPVLTTTNIINNDIDDNSGWKDYIKAEMQDAIEQNGEKVMEDGIVIVVSNTGKVIRRGVGRVPWRLMVEEIEQFTKNNNNALVV